MLPTKNLEYVRQAKARLTSMFRGLPVIEGLLESYVRRLQTLEGAIFDVLLARNLESDNDAALDQIGTIVQEARGGRTNTEYRAALRLRILVLKSHGRRAELIKIVALSAGADYWAYWDTYPAGFTVYFGGTVAALKALGAALRAAKSGGINGGLLYSGETIGNVLVPDYPGGSPTKLPPHGPSYSDGLPRAVAVWCDPLYFT